MQRRHLLPFIPLIIMAFCGCPGPAKTSTAPIASTAPVASTIVFADGPAVTRIIGSGAYTNAVSGDGDGSLTYSSGTPAIATVDASTGAVTLLALGKTLITANKAATETHTAASAGYTLTVTVSIGMSYRGGKVAYILQPGDSGYDADLPHGLIAAEADQSTGVSWAGIAYLATNVTGANKTAIGTGLANTNLIVLQNGGGSAYAAGLCNSYTNADTGTGGFSDWYLPSSGELAVLYANRVAIGGFADARYWSSSGVDASNARYLDFSLGGAGSYGIKGILLHVRAIRAY